MPIQSVWYTHVRLWGDNGYTGTWSHDSREADGPFGQRTKHFARGGQGLRVLECIPGGFGQEGTDQAGTA
jgi:hypothetical protein